MAFKPERPIPFNELQHMDADTVRFALALREKKQDEEDDWMAGLSEEERAIIEEENKKKKASRSKPCKIKECVKTEEDVGHQLLERASLLKKIALVEEQLKDASEDIGSLAVLSESTERELDKLTITASALKAKEKKELKEMLVHAKKVTHQLDGEISRTQAELRKLSAEAEAEAEVGAESNAPPRLEPSNLPNLDFTLSQFHTKNEKKHTGVYRTGPSGFPQWSCCRATDEDEPGCQDDQSVGVLSTLVRRPKSTYLPYSRRQAEHRDDHQRKLDGLHRPNPAPAKGNKGFRDVRQAISQQVTLAMSSPTRLADGENSLQSGRSGPGSVVSRSRSQAPPYPEMPDFSNPDDLGRASLSYLESNMMRASIEQSKFTKTRPSTSAVNGRMGSMRLESRAVTTGPFPVLTTVDIGADAYKQSVQSKKGMMRSDLSNARLPSSLHILDSASLLANYNADKVNKGAAKSTIGKKRHLGLKNMRRLHGRPATATTGPHLRQTSTLGLTTSLDLF